MAVKYIGHLFETLESLGFTCPAGSLNRSVHYLALKDLLYSRLTEEAPKDILERHQISTGDRVNNDDDQNE